MPVNKRAMAVGAIALGSSLLIFALTRKAGAAPGKANLYGKVTDAITGQALPEVLVSLNGIATHTDSGGNYAFTDLEPGEYILQFSKEGYQTVVY